MNGKLEILITNDDGIRAEGIHVLAAMMKKYGHVTVVAPLVAQSGKSASLSLNAPLYLEKVSEDPDLAVYTFTGTPVDCVKIAMNEIYRDCRPDLLMSGINHGTNCSVAALYSGTLGACIEGTLYEVPSMGFSINSHTENPDFSPVLRYGDGLIRKLLDHGLSPNVYLNVNFPAVPAEAVKGIRIGRRGYGRWIREFDARTDGQGKRCFVMAGHFENRETDPSGDHLLMAGDYISVVPHTTDNTDYDEIGRLKTEWGI